MIKKILAVSLMGLFVICQQKEVSAKGITTNLNGVVGSVSAYGDAGDPSSWGIDVGDPFKVTLTYDTDYFSPEGSYVFSNITAPEFSFQIDTTNIPNPENSTITIQNSAPGGTDQFYFHMQGYFQAYGTYDAPWDLNVSLNDYSGNAFSSTALPETLALDSFSNSNVTFQFLLNRSSLGGGVITFGGLNMQGSITSIEQNVIPEPSTLLLFFSGLCGCFWFRKP